MSVKQPIPQDPMTHPDSLPETLEALLHRTLNDLLGGGPAELIAAAETDLGGRRVTRLTLDEFELTVGHIANPMTAAAEGAPSLIAVPTASAGSEEIGQRLVLVANVEQLVRAASEVIMQKVVMELTHRRSLAVPALPLIDDDAVYSAEECAATWSAFASLAGNGLTRTLPLTPATQG